MQRPECSGGEGYDERGIQKRKKKGEETQRKEKKTTPPLYMHATQQALWKKVMKWLQSTIFGCAHTTTTATKPSVRLFIPESGHPRSRLSGRQQA